MKLEVTQSKIHLFEKCGRAFQFRYLEGVIVPPAAALTVGRSVDHGITTNLEQKINTKTDLPLSDVIDATTTIFEKEKPDTNWQDEDPGKQKDIAVSLVTAHHEQMAESIKPLFVQKKLEHELEDFKLSGTLDLIEEDGTIADSKTAKSAYDMDSVGKSLQPAVYSYLYKENFGKEAKGFRYDVLVKPTKTLPVRAQRILSAVSNTQKEMALKRANVLTAAVRSGVFHYAPDDSWYCSAKWCGFWQKCERGGKP